MTLPARIIHLEDTATDAEIVKRVITKSKLPMVWLWVSSRLEYEEALNTFKPDIILSDHSLPSFTSVDAFKVLRDKGLDIPFIVITATISEEFAVMMMKEGVADYLLKDRLQRLPVAIQNALDKWRIERERGAYQAEVGRNEKRFRGLIENIHDLIGLTDEHLNPVYSSKSYARITGWTLEERRMAGSTELIHPDDRQNYALFVKTALAEPGRHVDVAYRLLHKQGYYLWMEGTIVNMIADPSINGIIYNLRDVTARKNAEASLTKSEARFRALIENNYDAIVVRDRNLALTYASPSVFRMLGAKTPQILNDQTLPMVVYEDDVALVQEVYKNVLDQPGKAFSASLRLIHKAGHVIWVEGVITNMLDNENVKGIVANFRDITERREIELQQEKISLDLMDRNKDLEQYAYIVSHNLRGPVANILGIANLLRHPQLRKEDHQDALNGIFSAAENLDQVIADLNQVLQVKGHAHEKREPVNFAALVDAISASISGIIGKHGVQLQTDFQEIESLVTIKSYLYSIFYNLISNSIKYRRPGVTPIIRISSRKVSDRTYLIFQDNGMGIDLELQGAKIFGLYKRFHGSHAEGKGMGLFMVKTQVETLGGKIGVESQVDEGTSFTIEL